MDGSERKPPSGRRYTVYALLGLAFGVFAVLYLFRLGSVQALTGVIDRRCDYLFCDYGRHFLPMARTIDSANAPVPGLAAPATGILSPGSEAHLVRAVSRPPRLSKDDGEGPVAERVSRGRLDSRADLHHVAAGSSRRRSLGTRRGGPGSVTTNLRSVWWKKPENGGREN